MGIFKALWLKAASLAIAIASKCQMPQSRLLTTLGLMGVPANFLNCVCGGSHHSRSHSCLVSVTICRRFCHKWYYGENELWKHMADTHESCFLCKRSNPDRHVYYKDYEELEGQQPHWCMLTSTQSAVTQVQQSANPTANLSLTQASKACMNPQIVPGI